MADRVSLQDDHLDLLPFINILMCVLGCLLLIAFSISGLSLAEAPEILAPTAGASGKTPVLMIWDGATLSTELDGVVRCAVWPEEKTSDGNIPTTCPATAKTEDLDQILGYFRSHSDQKYPFIAVRPSGFVNLTAVIRRFEKERISIGYEPVAQNKRIELHVTGR